MKVAFSFVSQHQGATMGGYFSNKIHNVLRYRYKDVSTFFLPLIISWTLLAGLTFRCFFSVHRVHPILLYIHIKLPDYQSLHVLDHQKLQDQYMTKII